MLKKWITGILIVCTVLFAGAEEGEKPVVAVVLSGGGALGFAHVGVLKVLEEEGIRPDMVIGASIGSIIGGLYSVGYSADEIEGIILDTDWKYTLTDSFNRKELSYEQKKRQAEYHLSFATRDENRVEDAGFSHAQHVVELLDRLLAPYAVETDFDTLPIPFRAVGADLLTGERIVYSEGDLKTVIRASMAVPGVFTPVPYRGQYVIDGGWVDNLPTTVAKEWGADIIIAVSLFSMEEDIDELSSLTAVLSQSDQIRTIERNQKSLEVSDLVISPDLSGYGISSFEEGKPLMALGYESASAMREEIRGLAESLGKADPAPVRRASDDRVRISRITVDTGGDEIAAEKFRDAIQEQIGSAPVLSDLRDCLYGFYDTGEFTHVWYHLVPMGNGNYELAVDAPLQIHPAELFSTSIDFSGQVLDSRITNFILKTSYQRWLGEAQNTSASFELWLSEFPSVFASLDHHPMGKDLHITTKGYLLQSPQYFFRDDAVESMYTLDRTGTSFSMELPLFRAVEFRLGVYSEYLWVDSRLGVKNVDEDSWFRNGARNIVSVDTRDRVITPKRGLNATFVLDDAFDLDGGHIGKTQLAGEGYIPLMEGLIFISGLEYQSLLWGDVNPVELPALGGQIHNYGYYSQELRGENVGLFSCGMRKQIATLPLGLGDEIYLQLAGSVAATWDNEELIHYDFSNAYSGGSLGIVVNSIMGELEMHTGMNRDGRWSTFLGLSTTTSFFSEFD